MRRFAYFLCILAAFAGAWRAGFGQSSFESAAGPAEARAAKLFGKAAKEADAHKYDLALDDFRKADAQDGGRCVACEWRAYQAAMHLEAYKTAREETALLLDHVGSPEEKAEIHALTGDVCLAEGGYRIFEEPFRQANQEFEAALALAPERSGCLYKDGIALAHLHQYDKARARFEEYLQAARPAAGIDLDWKRAKLFATQPELARKRVAPTFTLTGLDGKNVSMQALQGKVVLIDFWATWCGPCKKALPHLKEIVEKFKGQPLVVLSISLDADEPTWKSFVAQNGMTWTQYRDGGFDGPIASQFAVKAIPTTFTIDADGFVEDQQVGDGEIEAKLKRLVAAAVAGQGKTVAEAR